MRKPAAKRKSSPVHAEPVEGARETSPERLAFRLVIGLYRASSGRAMHQQGIQAIARAAGITDGARQVVAISHAVKFGLLEHVGHDGIRLTEVGRQLLR